MLVIDPVALAEQQERDRLALLRRVDDPGVSGRLARLALATVAVDTWAAEELGRGATFIEILETVMIRAASMVGTQIVNAEITGNRRVIVCAKLAQMARHMAERVEASVAAGAAAPDPSNPVQ